MATDYGKLIDDEAAPDLSPTDRAASAPDTYGAIIDAESKTDEQQLKGSMFAASKTTPDREAQVIDLASSTNLPPALVKRNYDLVKQKAAQTAPNYTDLMEQSPKTAGWLKKPENAGVASDDVEAIRKVEGDIQQYTMMQSMHLSLTSGIAKMNATFARVPALAYDLVALPSNAIYKAIGKPEWQRRAPDWLMNNPVAKYYDTAADAFHTPDMDRSITEEIGKGNFSKAGRTLAAQFVANAPQQAAIIAGVLSGYGAAALAGAGVMEAADANKEAADKGADPASGTTNAVLRGGIEAAFEKIGTFGILKSWENKIAKEYGKEVSKRVFADFAKTVTYSMAGEGNEELWTSVAQEMSDHITGVNAGPLDLVGMGKRAIDAGIVGAASGGVMTGPSAFGAGLARAQQSRRAQLTKDFYLSLGESVEATKLRERLPAGMKDLVSQITKDSPVENVYLPVADVETFFQGQNQDTLKFMQDIGAMDAYTEAKATGGDVAIPLATWAEKVAGTEFYQGLADDVKFSPDDLTVNQVKKVKEEVAKAAETTATPEEAQQQTAAGLVAQNVTAQLTAAGVDEATAGQYAKLYESAFKTLGERSGLNPLELFNRYNLAIGRPEEGAPAQDQAAAQTMNQDVPRETVFLAWQDQGSFGPPFALYNTPSATGMTTVTAKTLEEKGIAVPATPTFEEWKVDPAKYRPKFQQGPVQGQGSQPTEPGQPLQQGTGLAQEAPVFAAPTAVSSLGNIAEHPDFVNLTKDASAVVRHHARLKNRAPDTQFVRELWTELHDAFGRIKQAAPDEKMAVAQEVLKQYPDIERQWQTLQMKLWADEADGFFDRSVAGKYGKYRPKVATEPQTFQQSPVDQTETPEFKKWFGDSRVVDENGQPLVVYHGSQSSFDIFDSAKMGQQGTTEGKGFYFTDGKEIADAYAKGTGNTQQVFLSMQNPILDVKQKTITRVQLKKIFERLLKNNPDALANYGDVDFEGRDAVLKTAMDAEASSESDLDVMGSLINGGIGTYDEVAEAFTAVTGFDGVITRWQDVGPNIYVAFRPTQIKSATGNRGTFDPSDANIMRQDARGQIRFGDNRKFNIDLLKNADLSTFLHESGHFYLEILGDLASAESATPQVKADYQALLDWFGVKDRAGIERKHHEQFARGFEAYLMDGKAPTSELRSVFAKFRAWLISIYRTVKNLNVELTPEVRGVMDRLLATDQELAAAQAEQNVLPLFADPKSAGMSDAFAAKYAAAQEAAKSAAEEELGARMMDQVRREQKAWWTEERDKLRKEVDAEVSQRKEYIALGVLQAPKDAKQTPNGIMPFKLSKKALETDYAEFSLKNLPKPAIYAKEGMHPELAASMFGYKSGEELLFNLENTVPKDQLVDQITDQRMKELHGDMMTDGTLAVEAMKAVHNQKRAQLLRMELQHLASEDMATLKGLVRRIARPVPTVESVRGQAEGIIAAKKVRDIRPSVYQHAEARAAREAMEAVLKGDFEAAFAAKQRELLNHELYRASLNALEEVGRIVDDMRRFDRAATRESIGKAGGDYLEHIDNILERYEFRRGRTLRSIDSKLSLLEWMKEQQAQGLTVDIPAEVLDEAKVQSYKETPFEELVGVRDSVNAIEHLARLKNKLLASDRKRELDAARDEIVSAIGAFHNQEVPPADIAPSLKNRLVKGVKTALAEHTRMEFLFEHMDGNKPRGVVWEYFFKPFAKAEDAENEMRRKDSEALEKIFDAYTKKERAEWFTKRVFIPEVANERVDGNFTKANMLTVALNWGNEYNREALMRGYGWDQAQVKHILDKLDARDWKMVQALWDHINSYWPEVAAQEKELNGLAPEKVEAAPVETEFGTFKGGYYPVIFDGDQSWRQAALDERANVTEMFGGNWARAMTKHGHTKSRTDTGGKPLSLELSGLTNHLNAVVHDLAFRPAIIDVSRLADDPAIRSSMEAAVGKEMVRQINPWLHGIAGDRAQDHTNTVLKLLSRARMGATVVTLGLKVTSAMVQTLGYTNTVANIGPVYAMKGLNKAFGNPTKIKKEWQFISERSKMMRDRVSNYDRDVRDYVRRPSFGPDTSAYFTVIGYMDLAVSMPTWLGAYEKAMDGKVENIDGGDENAATEYADSVVRQTQAAGAAKDLAGVQRGNEAWRLFTMFYSSLSILFNQFQRAGNQFVMEKNVPQLVGTLAMIWLVPAVLEEFLRGRGPGDDEEEKKAFLARMARKELMYPFQTMVGLRDVMNSLDRYVETGKKDFQGSPAFAPMESMVGALGLLAAVGDDAEVKRSNLRDAAMTVGYFAQLPARQIWQMGEYIYDWMTGAEQPDSVLEGVYRTVVTGKPRAKK